MLRELRSYAAFHVQAALSSFNFLCATPIATLMTVAVIAISLALPALFWVVTDNARHLTAEWQHGGKISLYLQSPSSSTEEISLLARIRSTSGVAEANLKSAAESLAELQTQEGMSDIMQYLPENPLPAVIEVLPALNVDTPQRVQALLQELKKYPHIEQAKVDIEWINRMHAIFNFAGKAARGLMALLACAVILIIGNTLRLTIHNRHEEIQVLKLVGAKDPFILRPFLYSGIWFGLSSALVALFLVNIFMSGLALCARQITSVYQIPYPLFVTLSMSQSLRLLVSAGILGWLGARLSVKRQLTLIEPY